MNDDLKILHEVTLDPDECTYIPTERRALTYRLMLSIESQPYIELLRRGWRRHGTHFFRPACPTCRQCRSLRLLVNEFQPTKSQRRTLSRNRGVTWSVRKLQVDDEHINLYNRYHEDMHRRRQWPERTMTLDEYYHAFVMGDWPFAREMEFRRDGKLIGVSLIDVPDRTGSSIYFYYDPDWRPASPGIYSMLCEIEYLKTLNTTHHYLGYWIEPCQSMAYKARFQPHELLESYVGDTEEPVWSRAPGTAIAM